MKKEKYLGPTPLGGSGTHHDQWTHATLDYKVSKKSIK
jgi:hypothetical protein